ncbi:crotonobetaine/carnitine-CoA ligase [Desulfocicer vacuolatum DSM 3385]|uniref:Crotonobetaine/carnitine-CoA ligase n=1 Tax=Desulfocicer vacuolatum DSM 3385 TaxID=1121400 RepID=A0A1W2EJ75_9BACT|nr:AMP-binding protein [Desulfocicer vacuolatum]SMD09781.1 crotonobetaine/carnitine-CoA ligase [Desulfocicer vacuolatum DSM 3385]
MANSKISGFFSYELDAKAEENPEFEILTFENGIYADEVLSYETIVTNRRKLAEKLRDSGFAKGDVLALFMRNHPEFVYSLYATNVIGAVLLPIDPRTKGERLEFVLRDSKARGVIFTSEFKEDFLPILNLLPEIEIIGVASKEGMEKATDLPDLEDVWSASKAPVPKDRCEDLNAPMEIIYTSGTTGDPKGVVLKNSRLAPFGMLAKGVFQYNETDKLYTGLSLTHGNAQAVTMVPALYLGIPAVISAKFTKSRIWDICRNYGCTSFSLLGGMMMGIFSEPEKSDDADNPVRLIISAGTPLSVWKSFEKRFGVFIHEWYGAVEGGFAHRPPGVGPVGSFGKPLDGVMEMKVVKDDDSECKSFEIGEIVCRAIGQKTEVRYFGKEDASEKKTRGGWLRSGDMGHRDENGWFFFDFRKGGGLRRAGDFIQPNHVEAAFAKYEEITDVCVYGIPAASGAPGEVIWYPPLY